MVYAGTGTAVEKAKLGISGVVIKLCRSLSQHLNFKVFTDNWFTCHHITLAMKVTGLLLTGTVS